MINAMGHVLRACGVLALCGGGLAWANSAPRVCCVTASQRGDDSKLVDIHYDLADADNDACTVWIGTSDNGGVSWRVPASTCSGDVGAGITPGTNKAVVWDGCADIPGQTGTFRVRVWADDGKGLAPKVFVPAGRFPYQNVSNLAGWVFVDTFLIDKYEITNAFYCQFLKAGGNDDHWVIDQEITRTGDPGNYHYTVGSGKENYPVRHVNYYDAEAFAQWRSQLEGVTWRLPTEQEWEKAAAWDPAQQDYYLYGFHSDSIDCNWCTYQGSSCGVSGPRVVGYFNGTGGRNDAKSYYGCYDMSGNVSEWVAGPSAGYYRGGSWTSSGPSCQCTYRPYYADPSRSSSRGFRLALGVD